MIETLIIIRTKNEDRWIKHTIEQINKQTYRKFKIIIVDNISKDRTLEIVKKYKIKIYKIKNFLPGKALNIPIKKNKSKFVVCLSAHCIPKDNDWLMNLIKPFKDPKVAAVYGKQLPMYNTNAENYRDLKIIFGNDKKIQKKDYFFHNANSAIRRNLLIKYPFDNKATNIEDRIWAKKIIDLKKGFKIIYLPSAAVYHQHGIHQSNNRQRLDGVIKIMKNLENQSLYPDSFLTKNQKIFACILGKRVMNYSKKYYNCNVKLINELVKNKDISKIIVVVNKNYFKKFAKISSNKFLFIERSKLIKSLSVKNVLKFVFNKFKNEDLDYMMYFNLDYLNRPKNCSYALINDAMLKLDKNITYGYKDSLDTLVNGEIFKKLSNKFLENSNKKINYIKYLFGIGSIFYFNGLKNLKFKNNLEFIELKNVNFLERESKRIE